MAPVTVVTPTRFASLSLRHDLGLQGFANVKFMEMPRLAELLGAASLSGRRPLTGVLQSILLRKVLEQADGPLAPVRDHTSTQNSLRASFGDLRNLDDEPLHRLEAPGGISGEVARLYGQFRSEASEAWYDAEDLAVAASEAVRHRSAPALGDLGHILFYLPRRVSLAQSDLMRGAGGTWPVLRHPGSSPSDKAADAPARDVAASTGTHPGSACGSRRRPERATSPAGGNTPPCRAYLARGTALGGSPNRRGGHGERDPVPQDGGALPRGEPLRYPGEG